MTSVCGIPARPIGFNTFADLTDVPVASVRPAGGGRLEVVFDVDLSPEVAENVWWRLTSRDAQDEQARRDLAAACAALEPPAPVLADQVAALQAAVCKAAGLLLGRD